MICNVIFNEVHLFSEEIIVPRRLFFRGECYCIFI